MTVLEMQMALSDMPPDMTVMLDMTTADMKLHKLAGIRFVGEVGTGLDDEKFLLISPRQVEYVDENEGDDVSQFN